MQPSSLRWNSRYALGASSRDMRESDEIVDAQRASVGEQWEQLWSVQRRMFACPIPQGELHVEQIRRAGTGHGPTQTPAINSVPPRRSERMHSRKACA